MARTDSPVRTIYLTGLQNAHALEREAISIIDRQLDRIENYPELAERLRHHRGETEHQIQRLEDVLDQLGETPSGLKDGALSLMGKVAGLSHSVADDEILKNAFANCALENFEIASYSSLIVMAQTGGFQSGISALQESLREEENMAQWCADSIEQITRRYLALRQDSSRSNH